MSSWIQERGGRAGADIKSQVLRFLGTDVETNTKKQAHLLFTNTSEVNCVWGWMPTTRLLGPTTKLSEKLSFFRRVVFRC